MTTAVKAFKRDVPRHLDQPQPRAKGGFDLFKALKEGENLPAPTLAQVKSSLAKSAIRIKEIQADIKKGKSERNDPQSVAKCLRMASAWESTNKEARAEAAGRLAKIGGPASYEFLLGRISQESTRVQLEIAKALSQIAYYYTDNEHVSGGFTRIAGFMDSKLNAATDSSKVIKKGAICFEIMEASVEACTRSGPDRDVADAFSALWNSHSRTQPHVAQMFGEAEIDLRRR